MQEQIFINCIDEKTTNDFQQAIVDILKLAKAQGATQAEACASLDVGISATVRMGNVEALDFNRGKSLSVTVYKGKRKGTASSTDLSQTAIQDAVNAACNLAKYTEEDEYSGLAEKEHLATNIPDLQLYHPAEISTEQALHLAQECEQSAMSYDNKIKNADGTTFFGNVHYGVYGNSNGFLAGYPSSKYGLSCAMIGQLSKKDSMQRDSDYTIARDFSELQSSQYVGREAARKTIARLGARKIKTIKAPVLFVPEMARDLIANFVAAISGGNLYRKTSFLLDSLQQKVFPEFINIYEDPFIPKGLGSAAFDGEGVATKRRELVKSGVLQDYVLGSYSARKLGMRTTGNSGGIHNLLIEAGKHDFNDLLKRMHNGLVVTEMLGHGVNLTTGDYSRGACGFWVQNGEIQYPVEEITIAGNLKEIFAKIVDVGCDVDMRSKIKVGSLLLDNMMIAGE